MKTRVLKVLNANVFAYENYQHSCYECWCSKYSYINNIPIRKLIVSEKIYSWYLLQWQLYVESRFLMENKSYIDSTTANNPSDLFKIFDELYSDEILKYYPKILFKQFTDASIKENQKP